MKAIALFLSGVAAMLVGAFIRSCNDGLTSQLSHSWCGAPPQALAFAHAHCAGCVLIATGAGLVALSPGLLARAQLIRAKARR